MIVMQSRVTKVESEREENLNILAKEVLYIKKKGIMAEIVTPIASGTETGGDLNIDREERIDNINASSAKTDSINQPV
jgi:hypothetical protein